MHPVYFTLIGVTVLVVVILVGVLGQKKAPVVVVPFKPAPKPAPKPSPVPVVPPAKSDAPGQEKKVDGDQSAKSDAPGQEKKVDGDKDAKSEAPGQEKKDDAKKN